MTVPTPTIRRAVPGDYDAICELADLMDQPQREALPDRFRKPSGPVRLRDRTEKLMHDPNTFLAVAELDGRVVGVTNCGLVRMGDFPQKHPLTSLLVRGLVVRPELRRKGIATALVGMSKVAHVEENLEVAKMPPAEMDDYLKLFSKA